MGGQTTVLGLYKPTIGGDGNTWGNSLNADLDAIDAGVVVNGGIVGVPGTSPSSNPIGTDIVRLGKHQSADRLLLAVNNKLYGQVWNDLFGKSVNTKPGYQILPTGVCFQWGFTDPSGGSDQQITFPVAFTSGGGFWGVVATPFPGLVDGSTNFAVACVNNPNNLGFKLQTRLQSGGSTSASGIGCTWFAWGNVTQ